MNRVSAAAAFALASLAARTSQANEETSTEVAPDSTPPTEIVVIGRPREDRGTVVSVMKEKEIERLGATNVGETLERLPAISSGNGARGERTLILRGFDQRQIAVFIDGVPVYMPYDGQLDLSKLPVDMVERITVVKGSGSLLYGPNGLGGAVNITTRESTASPSLTLKTETAPFSATRASAVGSASFGPISGVVGAAAENVRYVPLSRSFTTLPNQEPGRRDNSDRRDISLASKVIWNVSDSHRVMLSASRFGGVFGVPPATRDLTVRYWRWTDWESSSLGLSHTYRGEHFETEEVVYAGMFSNTLDSYDNARYASQLLPRAFHSIYDDMSLGGFARTRNIIPLGSRRQLDVRTWTGLKHDSHESSGSPGQDTAKVSTNIVTTSAQADLDVVPQLLRVASGVQFDAELPDTPPSGPKPNAAAAIGPLASISVTPARDFSITLSAASRTRFPTLRERFSTVFDANEPNHLLAPEHAWNFSIDAATRPTRTMRLAAGLFDSELRDLITSVVVAPQINQFQNVGHARFAGAEMEFTWSPVQWLEVLAGAMIMRARSGDALDQPVAYRPKSKGLVAITVTPWSTVSLTGVLRHVGEQDFQNPDTGVWGRLGAYQLFDARAEWRFHPMMRVWIRALNVTDANVEAHYSFPEPGRTIFVGFGTQVGS
ncbi:MAG: TonB-dependent receptor [Polyangiaceae bacterium]|nr:TonB-dependent receptor [Polyangiaceae bacterium]